MSRPRTPRRFKPETETFPGGWSRWVQPAMRRYWMQCCDCGLIHEMQFRIAANKLGTEQAVQFRARRARKRRSDYSVRTKGGTSVVSRRRRGKVARAEIVRRP